MKQFTELEFVWRNTVYIYIYIYIYIKVIMTSLLQQELVSE
jgi:hypothetical protein